LLWLFLDKCDLAQFAFSFFNGGITYKIMIGEIIRITFRHFIIWQIDLLSKERLGLVDMVHIFKIDISRAIILKFDLFDKEWHQFLVHLQENYIQIKVHIVIKFKKQLQFTLQSAGFTDITDIKTLIFRHIHKLISKNTEFFFCSGIRDS